MGKTIAEKIFESHLEDQPFEGINVIRLDAVFCHEITTPVAIADLVARGKDRVFDSTKIKAVIDHVTPAKDSKTAEQGKIMRDWAKRHDIKDFFDIGRNGVCHAIFPEKGFVRPGYTVIMGDSHTCTHGAFGAFAAGVGTTDLEVGILKGVCAFKEPKTIRFVLNGKLPKGVYAKDVILYIIGQIGVNGATNMVMEFTGPVVDKMSMESRMTLCNMAIEAGGTSGICYPDMTTVNYLWKFIKQDFITKQDALKAYSKFISDKDAKYEKVIEYDLSNLEPMMTVGYKPDEVKTVKEMEGANIDQIYIGSCTNGRIEDLRIASEILKGKKISDKVRGVLSPATPDIYSRALKEGIIDIFMKAGFCVTNPTCGACLGMSNGVLANGEVCASTTNRNFNGRMGKGGMVHLMSPATAAATAIAGKITNAKISGDKPKAKPVKKTAQKAEKKVKKTAVQKPAKKKVTGKGGKK
ncbi:MAG: 3-isopropylmalate dehydratase large subunit [Spirochaetes bacterium]|nr:3-isopropylmalate dehydratase large subunit [Spirochaetota bacterium]